MSLVPLLFRDWWDDMDIARPSRLLDQNFGMGLNREELLSSLALPTNPLIRPTGYIRPWRSLFNRQNSSSTLTMDKDKFQVTLDVQQFAPNEITVKASSTNNTIVVEGKHEEKRDEHGYVSRHFVRRYVISGEHDINAVESSLSSDGVLTVTAPKKVLPLADGERVVHIQHVGPAKGENQPTIEHPKEA